MTWPAATFWPGFTTPRRTMWQYSVEMPFLCWIFTYHPQPPIEALPVWSQLWPASMLHTTSTTVPAEAAWIGVPTNDMMSTPTWLGFVGVRKPGRAEKPGSGVTQLPASTTGAGAAAGAAAGRAAAGAAAGAAQDGGVGPRLT